MVESLRAMPPVPLLTSAPQQYLLFGLTNGHSSTTTQTAVLADEDPAVPAGETIDSLVRPLVESAKVAPPNGTAALSVTPPLEANTVEPPAPPPSAALLASIPKYAELAAPPVRPEDLAPEPARTAPPAIAELAIPTAPAPPAPPVEPANRPAAEPIVKTAPPIPPANPAAAQPPAPAPPGAAQPTAFLAPAIQIGELRIPPASPARSAPAEPANLPAAEPSATAPPPLPEPASLLASGVRFVELPAPPYPPAKTAPLIEPAKLAAAGRPSGIAPALPEPTPFRTSALQIARLRAPAASSVKMAGAIEPGSLAASRPLTAAPRQSTESVPFPAPVLELPLLAPGAEPFCAATGLANRMGAISAALQLQAETLLDEIGVRIEAYEAKIRAIISEFQVRPAISLLPAPRDIVAAPAPPDFQWLKTPRPVLSTRKPSDLKCGSPTAPPQKLPLAGPCLPPELRNFIEAPPPARVPPKSGIGLPAWIVSLVIATSLFLGAGTLLQYLATSHDAKAASVAATPGQAMASAPAAPVLEQHPFARFVEVTGLRVVADLNHRSQVQYIVVNHSSSQLSGMLLRIAVRSSENPAGSAPLFTVSAVVPSLGPHQSKEIRTDLDSELRSSAIPDWEYLRTEVQVVTQN